MLPARQTTFERALALGWQGPQGAEPNLQMFIEAATRNQTNNLRHQWTKNRVTANDYSGQYTFRPRVDSRGAAATLARVGLQGLEEDLGVLFTNIKSHVQSLEGLRNDDRMSFIFKSLGNSGSGSTKSSSTNLIPVRLMTSELLFKKILSVLASDESFDFADIHILVLYSRRRSGGGYLKYFNNYEQFSRKNAIITVGRQENTCFFQCLVLALMCAEHPEDYKLFLSAFSGNKKRQEELYRRAQLLIATCPIYKEGPVALEDIKGYSKYYKINIHIIDYLSMKFTDRVVRTHNRECYLLFTEDNNGRGHFDFVKNDKVGALWNCRLFCHECNTGYRDNRHRCVKKCKACKSTECIAGEGKTYEDRTSECFKCHYLFYSPECCSNHKCTDQMRCPDCNAYYKKEKDPEHAHECSMFFCRNCRENVPIEDHDCFHQPDTREIELTENYCFYDYECYLTETGEHEVAGVVVMMFDSDKPIRFESNTDFVDWLLQKKHEGMTCIAHNSARYDVHFIKRELIERGIKSRDVINGHSIMAVRLKVLKIRFIDSYRFIPISLRSFTKTFGIQELTKGYFPYRFLTPDRRYYEGRMPGIEWFDFDMLRGREYEDALEWYSEHKDDSINLYEMCMKYCESDVALLREGCLKFRELFLSITKNEIDPFQSLTIASVCMLIFRRFYLPCDTIAVLKASDNDLLAFEWLYSRGKKDQIKIEKSIEYEGCVWTGVSEDMKTWYMYLRCADYGCTRCFSGFTVHPTLFRPMFDLSKDWNQRLEDMHAKGYKVIYKFACEWDAERKNQNNQELLIDYVSDPRDKPLSIRDSFFGGRTSPIKLYKKCGPREKIRYLDYTSLYPSVNFGVHRGLTEESYKTEKVLSYPVGHPIRITDNFEPLENYFGFVKCRIIPPQDLYFPVLPEHRDGKLTFDLMPKIGTWTTIEVLKAVAVGYVIDEIYEVVHFTQRSDDLFKEYVKKFLKIKQQAAGWSKLGCSTDEEKEEYIRVYSKEQQIDLELDAIGDYNAGLYFISKLCLNSLWGKFGQRQAFPESVDTFSYADFDKIAHNDANEIKSVILHNHKARTITFLKKQLFNTGSKNTNIAVAAYTTAYARLRLYEALEILNRRVLYMDTDSVVFVDDLDNPAPLIVGPFLGDLTDELDGETITEFASTGPKSYAYKTTDGHEVCKIKGFTLNIKTQQVLNFSALKGLVLEPNGARIQTQPLQFDHDDHHNIVTRLWQPDEGKFFRHTFDKRKIMDYDEETMQIDTHPKKPKLD